MKVVCFGDSLTARKEGYPKSMLTMMLNEKVKGPRYINSGISGNTTEAAKLRLKEDVLAYHPDVVTILFGSNDCSDTRNIPLDVFKKNMELFIKKIGSKKVILITPPPVDESKQSHRKNAVLQQYVDCTCELAQQYDCTLIDFNDYVLQQENYEKLLIGKSDDGLHFGEKLYDQLSDLIAAQLKIRVRRSEASLWSKLRGKI